MAFSFDALPALTQVAYVHEMRNQALRTGEVEDRFRALKSAAAADKTLYLEGIGKQTLQAFIDQYHEEVSDELVMSGYRGNHVRPWEYTSDSTATSWSSPDYTRAHNAVATAMGTWAGIIITKPQSLEEYYDAALTIHEAGLKDRPTAYDPEINSLRAEADNDSLIVCDFSVPGTHFESDAVHALLWDLASQWKRLARSLRRHQIREKLYNQHSQPTDATTDES
jgi:hypothetical protein